MRKFELLILVLLFPLPGSNAFAEELHPFEHRQLSPKFYAEGANIADINRDGDPDVVVGPFWFQGPSFETRHAYYPPQAYETNRYSDHFLVFTEDVTGDGWMDILVIGVPGKAARLYVNPGGGSYGKHWEKHKVFEGVDNESPAFKDVNADGTPELICQDENQFGYVTVNESDPTATWTFHPISRKVAGGRFTHGLGAGDVNGDGRMDLLEKNGWWEQPPSLEGDPLWTHHEYTFTKHGGAQMLAYDVDGDSDQDVITSLNAHGYGLAWFENVRKEGEITFRKHEIMGEDPSSNRFGVTFSQLHALTLADIDGDGLKDLVTGKRWKAHNGNDPGSDEPAVLYWFRLRRKDDGVEFVPHPAHNNSGVGTQVVTGDLDRDGNTDIVTANKKGIYVHLQRPRTVSKGKWKWAHQPGMLTVGRTPKQTARALNVPDGFEVTLAASEPEVTQPIAMAYDHQGRLWVAEHVEYPKWSKEGSDRILVFEDTDQNGTLDRRTVFRENLNFVSGLEVGHGGVWVGTPPDLLYIPDRDGDLQPDGKPRVKLTGWGHADTHETLNGFIWGPDGWLYGCQGVFTESTVGVPGTPKSEWKTFNAGFWRYHPVKQEFELFARGTSNPWGIDFNDYGEAFSPVCVIPHFFHVVQGGRLRRQAGEFRTDFVYEPIKNSGGHLHHAGNIRQVSRTTDEKGGGHAHAGAMIYLGGKWPERYRNTLFMSNIRGNRINNDDMVRRGSGYRGKHNPDFLLSEDQWFRGINLRYGPDGDAFLIDWYDRQACHQQRPDDARNGRIYKVTYGEPDPVDVNLSERSDRELARMQIRENDWYVRHARRILQYRASRDRLDDEARNVLRSILDENPKVPRKLRAMWALHVTGGIGVKRTKQLLESSHEYVRAWTVRLSLEDREISDAVHEKLVDLARHDSSPVVRRFLASALQRLAEERRWPIAEGLVTRKKDRGDHNIPKLIWYGIKSIVADKPDRALRLASRSRLSKVRRFIFRRLADAGEMKAFLEEVKQKDEGEVYPLLKQLDIVLKKRANVNMPASWPGVYGQLMDHPDPRVRNLARSIAVRFGDDTSYKRLRSILSDASRSTERRKQALEALIGGNDPKLPPILFNLLDEKALRAEALKGLAYYEHPETPDRILRHYDTYSSREKRIALDTLASRVSYANALLDAIENKTVPRTDLTALVVRQMKDLRSDKIKKRLKKLWGQVRSSSEKTKKRIRKWKEKLSSKKLEEADLSAGRDVFNRTCATCHRLFGEGGDLGPDLTGSNRQNLDYLLRNIIDPNAVVGRVYQQTVVEMKDGRVIAGILQQETENALTVRTISDRVTVSKEKVKHHRRTATSMMPAGLLRPLSENEVRDLIAYLQSPEQVPLEWESEQEGTSGE